MFSLLTKIRFIVTFVVFIFVIQCSTSSPLENDKLAQLIERLNKIQTKVDSMQSRESENAQLIERLDGMQIQMDAMRSREEVLGAENAQLTDRLDRLQTKMDVIRSREEVLEVENAKLTERLDGIRIRLEGLEVENDKWTKKFGDLEAENEKLKNQISHPKLYLSPTKRDDLQSSRVLTSPPTSCQELKNQNGLWPMDGIHLLKKQNKIKAAFCTFAADGSPVFETLIGQVDVKTKTAHFYVQRNSFFRTPNAVIPFELARLNEGGAFNLTSGIFTVPVAGTYHFDLSAHKDGSVTGLAMNLQVNGAGVGSAWTDGGATGSHDVISLSASLRLAAGDRVNLYNFNGGVLYDDGGHHTHFSGWLVEEELM